MNKYILLIVLIVILLIFFQEKNNIESFDNISTLSNEAIQNLSSMYNQGVLSASNINLTKGNITNLNNPINITPGITTPQIKTSNITSENITTNQANINNVLYVSHICFDASNCMDVSMFRKLNNLNSYIYTTGQRMYFPDASNCTIYQNIFEALNRKFISKAGNPTYDDTTWSGSKIWNGLNMIKFGHVNEAAGNGLYVNVPSGHNVVWIRVLNERWTHVRVNYADASGELVGNYATGNRKLNRYSPDGGAGDSNNNHVWMAIALTKSSPVIIKSSNRTSNDFWVSGVATSTNPWNHSTNSAYAYYVDYYMSLFSGETNCTSINLKSDLYSFRLPNIFNLAGKS